MCRYAGCIGVAVQEMYRMKEKIFTEEWKMSEKHEVVVNRELCVGCGMCVKDCVSGCITVCEGKAAAEKAGCIACGHCEAVCPQGAITLTGFEDESIAFTKQTRLSPEELMQAIKSRRSIRIFEDKEIPKEVIEQIIEAGRFAPTGSNSQDTGYIILGSKQAELESMAVRMFRTAAGFAKPFVAFLKKKEIDDHFFFKKAPLVIVLTGSSVNASLAAENMAFMAEAHGLGVLFSGFFTVCANGSRKIRKVMGLDDEKVVTTLVIGYPAVTYYRTARREKAKVRVL